ncbi:MAG: alpha/beta hydrolase family protein [Microcoleaceae cyanobacterium]
MKKHYRIHIYRNISSLLCLILTPALALACTANVVSHESSGLSRSTSLPASSKVALSAQDCTTMIPPIPSGYGSFGPYTATQTTFESPLWKLNQVHVYFPQEATAPVPVVFFAHAYGAIYPKFYGALIQHIVSQGYAVVFSPYQGRGADHSTRYQMLWAGFEAAVQKYPDRLDLNRVGFMGHSYGGGAVPAMAYRALVERGWGTQGSFLFIMAPYYSFEIQPEQLQRLPAQTKLLMQVYEEEQINDHRIAIALFNQFNLAASEKDYVVVRSDQNADCTLIANHETPASSGLWTTLEVNGLDYYGVYRLFDALADYTFQGSPGGKAVALGDGSDQQTYMGTWPNGVEVKRLIVNPTPQPLRESGSYRYPQTNRPGTFTGE